MISVLICGGRNVTRTSKIRKIISQLPPDTTVIVGGARGADSIAENVARELGLQVRVFPADWATYGKAAGPIRNQQMLVQGRPDVVIAFWEGELGRGTADMLSRARKAGVPVLIFEA